jgi:hypothetical protein
VVAEVGFPDGVVPLIDHAAVIAVGSQDKSVLAERVAPHGVIGSIDDAVMVVVAGQADL